MMKKNLFAVSEVIVNPSMAFGFSDEKRNIPIIPMKFIKDLNFFLMENSVYKREQGTKVFTGLPIKDIEEFADVISHERFLFLFVVYDFRNFLKKFSTLNKIEKCDECGMDISTMEIDEKLIHLSECKRKNMKVRVREGADCCCGF